MFQVFRPPENYFSGIAPTFASYGAVRQSQVELSLYDLGRGPLLRTWWRLVEFVTARALGASPLAAGARWLLRNIAVPLLNRHRRLRGRLVATLHQSLEAVYDNTAVSLRFQGLPDSARRVYLLAITSTEQAAERCGTVWLSDTDERIDGHVWCSAAAGPPSGVGLVATLEFSNPVAPTHVPPGLLISTATQCNLNCIHCISRFSRAQLHRLSPAVRSRIGAWCRQGLVHEVATDYSGDILWADHHWGGDLGFLIDLQVPFSVATNGIHLTRDAAVRLMASRVRLVMVSLDAATDETYRRVRRGARSLEDVLTNMRGLSDARAQTGRSDVQLAIGFTLMRSTIHELEALIERCREVGFDFISTRHLEAYTGDMASESFWFDQSGFNAARQDALAHAENAGVTLFMPRAFEPRPERVGHGYCREPWRSAMVLGNGDVHVCCVPGDDMRMGNLNEQSMEDIWNGAAYQRFRRQVNSPTPPRTCQRCPIWRVENNRASYLHVESGVSEAAERRELD